jgi:hypothetical protein
MDSKRLGAAATIAAVGIATILTINEVQGWEMPVWLAGSLLIARAWMVIIAALVVALEIRKWLKQLADTWGIRTPIFRKDKPDPHQWLLDIAQEDADNPARHLIILKQTITNMDLRSDRMRPWIELGFTLYNGGVHNILVGPVKGHAHFKGDELSDPIEDAGGRSNKPRGHVHDYKVRQYLPADVAKAIYDEICRTQRVRSLGLSKVTLEVRGESPGSQIVQMSLGSSATFMMPD